MNENLIPKRLVLLILCCIILVAGGLRLYGLDKQSFRYDEVTEETGFQRQFLNAKGIIPYSPPLHLFFIYPVTKIFPKNDLALRMVPFIFGLLSVPLIFLVAKKMFNEKTALIAAFFLAVSPFHIWYSQEVRMYALQWLLALISFLFFLRTLEQPRLGNYAAYMLSVIAGLYTLQLNIFLMVIHGAYLLVFFKRYKTQILKWAGTFCLIIAFYIPYILFTYNSLGRITPIPRQMDYALIIPYTLFSYFGGFSIGPSLRELHFNQTLTVIEPYIYVVIPLLVLFGVITALGLFSTRKNHQNLLLLILMMIVPIIGAAIVIELTPTLRYNVRYTGMALFGFLIALAKGVDWISDLRPMKLGIILSSLAIFVLGGFSAYSYANYQFDKKYQKADIRGAAAFIKENRMPDDAILCIENIAVFNRYTMPDFECRTIPETVRQKKELVDIETADILEGKKRLWLVLSDDWYSEHLVNYIKYNLDTRYKEIKSFYMSPFDFANIRIYCYDLSKDRFSK